MSVSRFANPGADSPGFVLWKLTQRWQRAVADALEPLGVTQTQFVILACAYWLTQKTESVQQIDIAKAAGMDAQMVSDVLRRLEKSELVQRVSSPTDGRSKNVLLTDGGAGYCDSGDSRCRAGRCTILRYNALDNSGGPAGGT